MSSSVDVEVPDVGDEAMEQDSGPPAAQFAASSVDLGAVACGQSGSQSFTVQNSGSGALAVGAATTGTAFSVSPESALVAPGETATFTVTASVPASSAAGAAMSGSLNVFTNDPTAPSSKVPLSVTPSGATIAFAPSSPTSAAFPATETGVAAAPVSLRLVNTGNAAATVSLGAPSDAQFTLSGPTDGGGVTMTMDPGAVLTAVAGFSPAPGVTATASATAPATITGTMCGASVASIAFSGTVGHGVLSRWPSSLDFGPVACGGGPPDLKYVVLANGGATDATITSATITGAAGFSTNAVGVEIPAGLTADFAVFAPAVPALASTAPLTATLTILTDADSASHAISLTEEPQGSQCASP